MIQEEKELLLRDLCARLLYKIIVHQNGSKYDAHIVSLNIEDEDAIIELHSPLKDRLRIDIEFIKPYLRPMSSMTEEERQEYGLVLCGELSINQYDWLNAHHFDYRGLIEKGLALEAPEGMYNLKEK